jgi:two-component system chemotaxis response regulator CheB
LLVEPGSLALSIDPPINRSRPSIDALFESAANAYRHLAIGVVLTGANADGARGAARLHQMRAPLIVQDPATAEAPACPAAALERVPTAIVLPVAEIADRLLALCGGSRATADEAV